MITILKQKTMRIRIEGLTEVELKKIQKALEKPLKNERRIKIIVEDDEVQTLDGDGQGGPNPPSPPPNPKG